MQCVKESQQFLGGNLNMNLHHLRILHTAIDSKMFYL